MSFCVPPFRQTSSLQYLDARNTPLLDHSAPFVARALRISGSLAVLHLENAGLSGRPLMLLGRTGIQGLSFPTILISEHRPLLLFDCFVFPGSYSPQDEYEPAGVVPGRQQAQRPAGFSSTWKLTQVQLQYPDSRPAQQSHPRLWYTTQQL